MAAPRGQMLRHRKSPPGDINKLPQQSRRTAPKWQHREAKNLAAGYHPEEPAARPEPEAARGPARRLQQGERRPQTPSSQSFRSDPTRSVRKRTPAGERPNPGQEEATLCSTEAPPRAQKLGGEAWRSRTGATEAARRNGAESNWAGHQPPGAEEQGRAQLRAQSRSTAKPRRHKAKATRGACAATGPDNESLS